VIITQVREVAPVLINEGLFGWPNVVCECGHFPHKVEVVAAPKEIKNVVG
jgi:hypothetical protein